MKKYVYLSFLMVCSTLGFSQQNFEIKADIPHASGRLVVLKKFEGLREVILDSVTANSTGKVTLSYPANYKGAALLSVAEGSGMLLLLNKENFKLSWPTPASEGIVFTGSPENSTFVAINDINQNAEKRLTALRFLTPLYPKQSPEVAWIKKQILVQKKILPDYLTTVPDTLYAKYHAGIRKTIEIMQTSLRTGSVSMQEQMHTLQSLNLVDPRLQHSGMLSVFLEGHFHLLETAGLDSMYTYFNKSTDIILAKLEKDPGLKQDAAEFLFKSFEKQSQFPAAEYLARAMLDDNSCIVDARREALFEQYRKMAVGKTAPEIVFEEQDKETGRLTKVGNRYKLVVFGSSWCPQCAKEIPELKTYYTDWNKNQDLQIVLVSLDTDKTAYQDFTKDFPWISTCDFNGWESKIVRDYYVMGTPTMYLLDKDNRIALKPISAAQVDAWLKIPH